MESLQAYKEVLTDVDKFKELFPDGIVLMGKRNEGGEFNTRAGLCPSLLSYQHICTC